MRNEDQKWENYKFIMEFLEYLSSKKAWLCIRADREIINDLRSIKWEPSICENDKRELVLNFLGLPSLGEIDKTARKALAKIRAKQRKTKP